MINDKFEIDQFEDDIFETNKTRIIDKLGNCIIVTYVKSIDI